MIINGLNRNIRANLFSFIYIWELGAWGSVVVKALRYKSGGPGIDSRCRRDFSRGI